MSEGGLRELGVLRYILFFTMEPAAVLSVADLRGKAITKWIQDVKLHIPFQHGPPMEVPLIAKTVLPIAMFEYQLSKAVYQGTGAGERRQYASRIAKKDPIRVACCEIA